MNKDNASNDDLLDIIMGSALLTKIGEIDVNSLLEVCKATPNTIVAVSILMGTYVKPQMNSTRMPSRELTFDKNVNGVLQLERYDKFTDRVRFSFIHVKEYTLYFRNQEEADQASTYDGALGMDVHGINNDVYTVEKSFVKEQRVYDSCTLKEWNHE